MEPSRVHEKDVSQSRPLFWSGIALIIAAVTIAAVFIKSRTMTFAELHDMFWDAKPGWIIMSFIAMLGFIYFEGLALLTLLRAMGYGSTKKQSFIYGAADAYFSAITPSATGGQPAVMYFMVKYGVPVAAAAAALVLNLILYNMAMVGLGVFAVIMRPEVFLSFDLISQVLIVVGSLVIIAMAVLLILLLKKGKLIENFMDKVVGFLAGHHIIRKPEKWLARIENLEKDYEDAGELIAGKPAVMVKACIFNVLQRVSQLMVPVFMDLAIKGSTGRPLTLWATQCYVTLGAHCIPVPGAMGVSDYLMIDGFQELMDDSRVYRLELLSRGMAFYFCVIFACMVVLIAYLRLRGEKKR